jgi:predicted outer membrane protein
MRKLLLLALALAGLVFGAGAVLAQADLEPDKRLRLPQPPGAVGLSVDEKTFIDHALAGASAIIDAGRLASQHAKNDAIRSLATEVASDQQKLRDDLTRLSESKGYKPENATAPAELAPLTQLAGKTGSDDFDRAYLTAQNQASHWLLGAYQTEMAHTQDTQLRTFAADRELLMRKHLDAIQKVASAMGMQLERTKNAPQY